MRTIYHQVSDRIEQYITDYGITGRMPGILKLSNELGLNRVTLQKAFRELERRGVVTICGTRGTFVNNEAPQRPRYRAIGILGAPGNENDDKDHFPYQPVEKDGYQLIGINLRRMTPELLEQFPVDGFIMLGSYGKSAAMNYLLKRNIPVVANLNIDANLIDRVEFDHYNIFGSILQRLKVLGHRRIAYVDFLREEEFQFYPEQIRKAFQDNLGADFDEKLFYVTDFSSNVWRQAGERYWRVYADRALSYFLEQPEPPTAIVWSGKIEIYEAVRERGIKIPEEMSLFGVMLYRFGDRTVMRPKIEELQNWGYQRLLMRLNNRELPLETYLVGAEYYPGNTIGPARSGSFENLLSEQGE